MIAVADITVVLPAYNEATALQGVIQSIHAAGFERILVVDDGSQDRTSEVARTAGVQTIQHPINLGAGAAVQTAIELARRQEWPYLIFMDADGQHDPQDILLLKTKMEATGSDIVVGSRFLAKGQEIPNIRKFYNFLGNLLTNIFTHHHYTDSQSGLRLLNRRAIELLNLEINGFGFCSEMLIKAESAQLKVEETPTSVLYTEYSMGKGQDFQMGLNTAFHFLWNALFK